jgi:hypothetical protein
MNSNWPQDLPVAQVRIARPTDKLQEIERFYCQGLGLKKLGYFEDHAGFDGLMIGLPSSPYHLEFTHYRAGSPGIAPTKENLLVLYIPDRLRIEQVVNKLADMGYPAVDPENPYWLEKEAITVEDPDKWRIVLMPTEGLK